MAFVRIPQGAGKEQVVAPEGEYDLVVRKLESKKTRKGDPMYVATIGFDGNPEYSPFREYITLPGEATPPDQAEMRWRNLKRFLAVFNVPQDEDGSFDTDDIKGATGRCRVACETVEGERGDFETNRLVLPRLAS